MNIYAPESGAWPCLRGVCGIKTETTLRPVFFAKKANFDSFGKKDIKKLFKSDKSIGLICIFYYHSVINI